MASIHKRGNIWSASFRFGGTQFLASLKTKDEREAERARARIEETIRLLNTGRVSLPPEAKSRSQIIQYIVSGGALTHRPRLSKNASLAAVLKEYFETYTIGKEPATIEGERIHANHFKRVLGAATVFSEINTDKLQTYAAKRCKEKGLRGRKLSPETVKKEFRTFTQIWKMAVAKKYVSGPSPAKGVRLNFIDESPPFMTWDEIETIIERGGLTEEQQKDYWDCLFLDEKQVLEVVEHVEENAEHRFIYAAIAFAAFTGARRSEIIRSQIEDWDFKRGIVHIREKKGSRKRNTTFRDVNIHPKLAKIMKAWFKVHPGGIYTIVIPPNLPRSRTSNGRPMQLTRNQAHTHFVQAMAGDRWKVLKGWHVLRHSFCSNCARRGVPDSIIDAWMGHRGDEAIKKRYRHLFPCDRRKFMGTLFS
jgi:integrase